MHGMDLNWDDLRTVMCLVRGGSLAAAAQELGINYTTVARRVARAETQSGVKLFERLADGYEPTDAGRLMATRAAEMEQAEQRLAREFRGRDETLSGPLVVTAPQLLIAHSIAPAIKAFGDAHPDVDLNVKATNEVLDLSRRDADLALRISNNPGDTLKGRRLTVQSQGVFASPDWAKRIDQGDSDQIDWIVYDQLGAVPRVVDKTLPNSVVRYRFDDMVAMAGAAQAGLGLVRMPVFLGRSLAGLVQIPQIPTQPYFDIWAVAHADVWPSAKVAAFRAVIADWFRRNQSQFVDIG